MAVSKFVTSAEVEAKNIGTVANLTTDAKDNLVNAINELENKRFARSMPLKTITLTVVAAANSNYPNSGTLAGVRARDVDGKLMSLLYVNKAPATFYGYAVFGAFVENYTPTAIDIDDNYKPAVGQVVVKFTASTVYGSYPVSAGTADAGIFANPDGGRVFWFENPTKVKPRTMKIDILADNNSGIQYIEFASYDGSQSNQYNGYIDISYADGRLPAKRISYNNLDDAKAKYAAKDTVNADSIPVAIKIVREEHVKQEILKEVGDKSTLTTTEKSNIVGALNEINKFVGNDANAAPGTSLVDKIGNLDDLMTTEKTSVVGSINEIDTELTAAQADILLNKNAIGDLTKIDNVADKSNLVNAINEATKKGLQLPAGYDNMINDFGISRGVVLSDAKDRGFSGNPGTKVYEVYIGPGQKYETMFHFKKDMLRCGIGCTWLYIYFTPDYQLDHEVEKTDWLNAPYGWDGKTPKHYYLAIDFTQIATYTRFYRVKTMNPDNTKYSTLWTIERDNPAFEASFLKWSYPKNGETLGSTIHLFGNQAWDDGCGIYVASTTNTYKTGIIMEIGFNGWLNSLKVADGYNYMCELRGGMLQVNDNYNYWKKEGAFCKAIRIIHAGNVIMRGTNYINCGGIQPEGAVIASLRWTSNTAHINNCTIARNTFSSAGIILL